MNNHIDSSGFYHDAPVVDGEASSNNGIYYTAIAFKLGLKKGLSLTMYRALSDCAASRVRLSRPGLTPPPLSRDEALGLIEMGFNVFDGSWSFSPEPLPKFSLKLFITQAFHCLDPLTGKLLHRNTFWQKGFTQINHVAYSCPLSDRHYLAKKMGRRYNPIYHLLHIILHWRQPTDRSARLLRWFKTGKDIEAVVNYFGEGHPFVIEVKKRMGQQGF
jgi:hypothetical protein